jgi:hypothetical protein
VGANQKSKDALAQLRNAREGNAKRTDQYQVSPIK